MARHGLRPWPCTATSASSVSSHLDTLSFSPSFRPYQLPHPPAPGSRLPLLPGVKEHAHSELHRTSHWLQHHPTVRALTSPPNCCKCVLLPPSLSQIQRKELQPQSVSLPPSQTKLSKVSGSCPLPSQQPWGPLISATLSSSGDDTDAPGKTVQFSPTPQGH